MEKKKLLEEFKAASDLRDLKNNEINLFKAALILENISFANFADDHGFDKHHFVSALNHSYRMKPEYNLVIQNYLVDIEGIFLEALCQHKKWLDVLLPLKKKEKLLHNKTFKSSTECPQVSINPCVASTISS